MKKTRAILVLIASILTLAAVSIVVLSVGTKTTDLDSDKPNHTKPSTITGPRKNQTALQTQLEESFGQMPVLFVENQGQWDEQVTYAVQGSDKTLYFTSEGVTFALTKPAPSIEESITRDLRVLLSKNEPLAKGQKLEQWSVKLDFLGANPGVRPVGQQMDEAVISYFEGQPDQWHTGLPTYRRLVYQDLWPGIDLVYEGTVNRLKYHFVVRPGADPDQIRLAYRGATSVTINSQGSLVVETPYGGFQDDTPLAYQEVDGERMPVSIAYELERAMADSQPYHFVFGEYEPSLPLILDPAVLVYAGYIGGSEYEIAESIAVDDSGNAYVTGITLSSEATFPATIGPDLTYQGNGDVYVAKVNAAGTGLVYAGYIGGSDWEYAHSIAVDGSGNAYVTGVTDADETTFPVVVGPDLTQNGLWDVFVAKVNSAGTGLDYAGFIGGSSFERGNSIAVDGSGNAYVTGHTQSSEATFPVTAGPDLTYNGGETDVFVAKVNSTGSGLIYAGYIGGSSSDGSGSIAVDSSGNAFVAGGTESSEATFPVTVGPDLTLNGESDAYVAKVNSGGTGLDFAGYIGGSGLEGASGVAVDESGNAYVTGSTTSSEATFPVLIGPDLTYNGGVRDTFVAKVNPAGTGLVYAGYIGGDSYDDDYDIAVDSLGSAYVVGGTGSTEATFPVAAGPDLTFNGTWDAFVAKVNTGGTGLDYAGYIGGSAIDEGWDIAVDGSGNAYIAGRTESSEATFPETIGPDLTYNGLGDAFVAKVALIPGDPPPVAQFSANPTSGPASLEVDFTNLSTGDFDTCDWDFGDGGASTNCNDPSHTYTTAGIYTVILTVAGPGGSDIMTKLDYITIYEPPVADFIGDPTSGPAVLGVNFTNLSTGDFTTCDWDFGDGATLTDCSDPVRFYGIAGNYTVTLAVDGPGGSDTSVRPSYINVFEPGTPPNADFSGDPTSGTEPLTVNFTNQSTGDYSDCTWDFGDSGTSTECQDVSHTFLMTGSFTVSLTVSGTAGISTFFRPDYITVTEASEAPVAEFSADPTNGTVPLAVVFSNESTGDFDTCDWDFGDGAASIDCDDPTHTYMVAGTYTVTLGISGPSGSDTMTKSSHIVASLHQLYLPAIIKP